MAMTNMNDLPAVLVEDILDLFTREGELYEKCRAREVSRKLVCRDHDRD